MQSASRQTFAACVADSMCITDDCTEMLLGCVQTHFFEVVETAVNCSGPRCTEELKHVYSKRHIQQTKPCSGGKSCTVN